MTMTNKDFIESLKNKKSDMEEYEKLQKEELILEICNKQTKQDALYSALEKPLSQKDILAFKNVLEKLIKDNTLDKKIAQEIVMYAIEKDFPEAVLRMFEEDVFQKVGFLNQKEALFRAVEKGCLEIVEILFSPSMPTVTDINSIRNKQTVLETAIVAGHLDIVKFLLQKDGQKASMDLNGVGVLFHALRVARSDILQFLFSQNPPMPLSSELPHGYNESLSTAQKECLEIYCNATNTTRPQLFASFNKKAWSAFHVISEMMMFEEKKECFKVLETMLPERSNQNATFFAIWDRFQLDKELGGVSMRQSAFSRKM